MKKLNLLTRLSTFFLVLLLWNCDSDNLSQNDEVYEIVNQDIKTFINGFDISLFNETRLKNLEPNWDEYIVKENVSLKVDKSNNGIVSLQEYNQPIFYEFVLIDNQQVKFSQASVYFKLLVEKTKEGFIKYSVLEFYADKYKGKTEIKNSTIEKYSYLNIQNYSGTVVWYNEDGKNYRNEYFDKGELQESFEISNSKIEINSIYTSRYGTPPRYERNALDSTNGRLMSRCGSTGGGGSWALVTTHHYTQNVYIWSNGSTGEVFGITFGSEQYNGSSSQWVYINNDYSYETDYNSAYSYNNTISGSSIHPAYVEQLVKDDNVDKIYNELTGKANCAYQKLSLIENFQNLVDNFTGEETPYNLTFEVVPDLDCQNDGDIDEGCTSNQLNSNNSITISLDLDYVTSSQTPTLIIAQTIIHEVIHANLYLALYNLQNGNTTNLPDINDFPAIYEQYRQYKGWQHEFMANHYTELISKTLQEVHQTLNDQPFIDSLENYDMSIEEYYTSLAFVGLNGTTGQTNYLNDSDNATNYNISFYDTMANSTKEPNCE